MSTDGLWDGSLPRRRESWHRDRYNWYWDQRHVVRHRLHHAWRSLPCSKCGLRRYSYLQLLWQVCFRKGNRWLVRSHVLHRYRVGELVPIAPPSKPKRKCRCLAWAGPVGLVQQSSQSS